MIRDHYKSGRASAFSGNTNYELVEHLRTLRESGDAAMFAVEEYDPDFSLKLAEAADATSAEGLLSEWLKRRINVLEQTRQKMREAWKQANSGET